MNENLGKVLGVVCIGLAICVLVLFSKVNSLSETLADVRNSINESDTRLSDELVDVRGAIKESNATSRSEDAQLLGKIESTDKRSSENTSKLRTTENELRTELEALSVTTKSNKTQLAKLKKDAIGGLESALTKELVRDTTKLALEKLNAEESILIDPKFVSGVAEVLVRKFKEDLRGEPGRNADNEAVAVMLSKNPDFLDSVSVTALLVEGKQEE